MAANPTTHRTTKNQHDPAVKLAFPPKRTDLVTFEFTEKDLEVGLSDPRWRLSNLYTIVNARKEVVIFRPNLAQTTLLDNMWYRNAVLKARKMGFSTQIQLLGLDTTLFSANERMKVIAQDVSLAEGIFRDVLKFAYDNLPEPFRIASPTVGEASKSKIEFKNNSIVEVTTSARGTTPTYLHISELGKIAAKDPGKAREIQTGSITAAAEDAIIFVESTAEGQMGVFFDLIETARKMGESGAELWKLDFKLFFFGWWQDPKYVAPANSVPITPKDHAYFDRIENELRIKLSPEQRAWYVKFREVTYAGSQDMMYQEMPSTVEEPFKVSMEGAYFTEQFSRIRKENRIGTVPYDPHYPVSLFFDIGANDETAIWFIQPCRTHYAVIDFYEATAEPYQHFVEVVDGRGYTLDYVYLPHDANHRRQGEQRNLTPEEMLQNVAPHWRFWLVPRTPDKIMAIQQARNFLPMCVFDESRCKDGIRHLESYRKTWDARLGTWRNTPRHDASSNAADAFLQAAQAKAGGYFSAVGGAGGAGFGNDNFGGWYSDPPLLDY